MFFSRIIVAVGVLASLCAAQTINIQGVVKDTTGIAVAGATVRLDSVGISTTTGADGHFVLSNAVVGVTGGKNRSNALPSPVRFQNGRIMLNLPENAQVTISAHDIAGRQLYRETRSFASGTHTLPTIAIAVGVGLYRVTVGQNVYSFKTSPAGLTFKGTSLSGVSPVGSPMAKRAEATTDFGDIIIIQKEGMVTFMDTVLSALANFEVFLITSAGDLKMQGHIYPTIKIGNQVWITENLRATHYSNSAIPYVHYLDTDKWLLHTSSSGAYTYVPIGPIGVPIGSGGLKTCRYGALYNWNVASSQFFAPPGWRVPSAADWDTLINNLVKFGYNWDGSKTGNKVAKALVSQSGWESSCANSGAPGCKPETNNKTGFSVLPGGFYWGSYIPGHGTGFWTTTEGSKWEAHSIFFHRANDSVTRNDDDWKHNGNYIRLVRDWDGSEDANK